MHNNENRMYDMETILLRIIHFFVQKVYSGKGEGYGEDSKANSSTGAGQVP